MWGSFCIVLIFNYSAGGPGHRTGFRAASARRSFPAAPGWLSRWTEVVSVLKERRGGSFGSYVACGFGSMDKR